MNSRAAQSALVPGRVITTLNPTTHLSEIGLVIDHAQAGRTQACAGLTLHPPSPRAPAYFPSDVIPGPKLVQAYHCKPTLP